MEKVSGHLHFVKVPIWQHLPPFVSLQETSEKHDDRQKHVLGTFCATTQLHYLSALFASLARHLCGETYSKYRLEMLLYLLQRWHEISQHNYPRSSPKFHLQNFHIACELKQGTSHSKIQSKFWIIYVAFLQLLLLNAFPHIGTEVIKTTMDLAKRSK